MPPRKHEVDPENQGMLLAPSSASIRFGTVIDHAGVYYRPPTRVLSAEQQQAINLLQFEEHALSDLALISRSQGHIEHLTNQANKVNQQSAGSLKKASEELERMSRDITESEKAIEGLRVSSKVNFARSVGISAHTEYFYKTDAADRQILKEGKPVVDHVDIIADDPDEQDRLDQEFKAFEREYGGSDNAKHRDNRRAQIPKDIEAIKSAAA